MPCRMMRILFAIAVLTTCFAPMAGAQSATSAFWSEAPAAGLVKTGERVIFAEQYRPLALDRDGLAFFLANAPLEGSSAAAIRPEIALPLPDGSFGRFSIVESPIMAPELQARYPEIRTYAGYGIDDPSATVRFDLTPAGFHALIFTADGTIYIDPLFRGDDRQYQSYYRRDFRSDKTLGGCTVVDEDGMGAEIEKMLPEGLKRSGTQLRTYRAAVAATGEYTTYHGGTVAKGLAAVVTSMNRVDGVYEKELAIRMVLVANNNLIIYTNASTDPYTNNNGSTMLGQNQTNLDSVIGTANYDVGHVFSTGGGGIAGLGVVCRAGQKAKGVTGSSAPIGDAFDIDYVAHEIGHEFGANHPFNGNAGSCAGGNRNAATAYEPGSGSTIMAYAGICTGQDLQMHSDDYFLWISIQEIVAYTTTGLGNGCPVTTSTGVINPVPNAGASGFAIPISTPFTLTASATTTGTPTYCWEESDLGPAGAPDSPSGTAPIFRSFLPVSSPSRTFPKTSDLLNNVHTMGELLPSYARNMSFKVTVRDTQAGGVGVAFTGMSFTVASSGPFLVTSPNTAVTWAGGSPQTVTWNVASTTASPVSCSTVNIRLSTDGGYTFPTVLAAGTSNDGSEVVTLPNTATTLARIKVEAAANVFFDLSNVNFTITATATGACCATDGSCTVTTQANCVSPGAWQGEGTNCTPNLCPPPTGSCCAPDGSCAVTLQAACTGAWTMFGVCVPNACPQPTGSCCAADGSCTVTLQAACTGAWTMFGVCTPNPCVQPTGSCCTSAGACTVTLESVCKATWTMFGECEPNPCPLPHGRCCAADGSCTVTLQAACTGTWTMFGVCTPNPCAQPSGSCCAPDGSCTETLQAACTGAWTLSGVCTPNTCAQPTGSCCAPDGSCTVTTEASCTGSWTLAGTCQPDLCASSGLDNAGFATVLGVRATPNPFTWSVALRVAGPKGTAARIVIFDPAGRLVRTVWGGMLTGRSFTVDWDGRDDSGREAPAGVYLVRGEGTTGSAVVRLVLIR
jgi:hypothetical protein